MEKYLRQCLDSLVHQTLKNIEIIVVNDCSPDNSEEIILEYAEKDDRIVYIKHEENKGLGGARNTGIRVAQGEYIAFVDSDDYVDVRLYEAALKVFEKYDIDIVSMPFRSFSATSVKIFFKWHPGIYRVHISRLLKLSYINAWSKIYRRADIERYGFIFPEQVHWEDVPFWTELCAVMNPRMVNLPPWAGGCYHYRCREDSIVRQRSHNGQAFPLVFLFAYQRLSRRGIIENYYQDFCRIVAENTVFAWYALTDEAKIIFARNFALFTKEISFSMQLRHLVPEWRAMADLHTDEGFIALIEAYTNKINLTNDPWYCFGQLPMHRKFFKFTQVAARYFFAVTGLRALHRVFHKILFGT